MEKSFIAEQKARRYSSGFIIGGSIVILVCLAGVCYLFYKLVISSDDTTKNNSKNKPGKPGQFMNENVDMVNNSIMTSQLQAMPEIVQIRNNQIFINHLEVDIYSLVAPEYKEMELEKLVARRNALLKDLAQKRSEAQESRIFKPKEFVTKSALTKLDAENSKLPLIYNQRVEMYKTSFDQSKNGVVTKISSTVKTASPDLLTVCSDLFAWRMKKQAYAVTLGKVRAVRPWVVLFTAQTERGIKEYINKSAGLSKAELDRKERDGLLFPFVKIDFFKESSKLRSALNELLEEDEELRKKWLDTYRRLEVELDRASFSFLHQYMASKKSKTLGVACNWLLAITKTELDSCFVSCKHENNFDRKTAEKVNEISKVVGGQVENTQKVIQAVTASRKLLETSCFLHHDYETEMVGPKCICSGRKLLGLLAHEEGRDVYTDKQVRMILCMERGARVDLKGDFRSVPGFFIPEVGVQNVFDKIKNMKVVAEAIKNNELTEAAIKLMIRSKTEGIMFRAEKSKLKEVRVKIPPEKLSKGVDIVQELVNMIDGEIEKMVGNEELLEGIKFKIEDFRDYLELGKFVSIDQFFDGFYYLNSRIAEAEFEMNAYLVKAEAEVERLTKQVEELCGNSKQCLEVVDNQVAECDKSLKQYEGFALAGYYFKSFEDLERIQKGYHGVPKSNPHEKDKKCSVLFKCLLSSIQFKSFEIIFSMISNGFDPDIILRIGIPEPVGLNSEVVEEFREIMSEFYEVRSIGVNLAMAEVELERRKKRKA